MSESASTPGWMITSASPLTLRDSLPSWTGYWVVKSILRAGRRWPRARRLTGTNRRGAQEPALNAAIMASLRAQDGLLDGLIGTVLKEVPERLQQISASLARADSENVAIAAHSLKAIAAIFGARRMPNSAANIERTADARSMEGARAEFEGLRTDCERVLHELEKERARPVA